MDNIVQGFEPDGAETDVGMSVLVGASFVFGVVDMDHLQRVQADYVVELVQNTVEVIFDVITRIVCMARIQRHG